jgi:hypothetical protein
MSSARVCVSDITYIRTWHMEAMIGFGFVEPTASNPA